MIRFITKRLGWAVFVVFAALSSVFLMLFAIGDPCRSSLGPQARQEQIAQCQAEWGYDEPVLAQYLSYMGVGRCVRRNATDEGGEQRAYCGLLQGDLSKSMSHREAVGEVLLTRLPRTLLLGAIAMTFELSFGLIIGVLAAVRRNTWFDTGFMATAFVGISAPSFLTGLLFLDWIAFRLGWFPVGGYGVTNWDHVYSAILPAFTLAIIGAATYARIMRGEMIETLRSDYIRTARAKGVGPVSTVVKHAVRNALLPIVTMMGMNLTLLVSGAVITEKIYAWPGMGSLAVESIYNVDLFTVMGIVLFASLTVQGGNLLADIAVASLDPRVRLEAN